MHQSAIIYRDDSARFIYVCYHCGTMFNEINATLQHIETHFQVANVMVDQITEEVKEEDHFAVTTGADNIAIKLEFIDDDADVAGGSLAVASMPINSFDKQTSSRVDFKVSDKKTKKIVPSGGSPTDRKKKSKQERIYRCHKCPSAVSTVTRLRSHMKKHKDDELLQIFKCKECDVYFKSSSSLRVHVLGVHLGKKRFECAACGVRFNFEQSKLLLEHLQRHKGSKKTLWTDLAEGIRHDNSKHRQYEEIDSFTEEQHCCEFCTQRFYITSNLDAHMKSIHSGQRRMQCFECLAIFTAPKVNFDILNFQSRGG